MFATAIQELRHAARSLRKSPGFAAVAVFTLAVGLAVSSATNRLLSSQLLSLSPHDPLLLITVSTILLLAALSASAVPARRAACVDPMAALRHE